MESYKWGLQALNVILKIFIVQQEKGTVAQASSFSDDGDEGESSAPNTQLDCRKPQWGFLRVFTAIRLAPKLALKYYSPLHLSVL